MFKKDDYIVILDGNNYGFKTNYIIKQRENIEYVRPYLDCKHSKTNGLPSLVYNSSVWRYATQEEIDEYDRLGKPYDVTTLKPFVLPNNWHILVTEENIEDCFKWRFKKRWEDNLKEINYSKAFINNKIIGFDGKEKGHNDKHILKGDRYDFGIEITYEQFKRYVLNKEVNTIKQNYDYLIPILNEILCTK